MPVLLPPRRCPASPHEVGRIRQDWAHCGGLDLGRVRGDVAAVGSYSKANVGYSGRCWEPQKDNSFPPSVAE